ncbi:hypothetical protein SKAU_G00156570 [Synaphobranchus kaupii]|uniref:Insulin-like growth factor-binding protein 6 n=1 Tax=Synaphobranchus kaupii TaxID=118154 RepID=A0A9Q1IZH3_SYNKA|nr:hypothetical protein SKAU_G00156570 [Synaphobranchus kaupii]
MCCRGLLAASRSKLHPALAAERERERKNRSHPSTRRAHTSCHLLLGTWDPDRMPLLSNLLALLTLLLLSMQGFWTLAAQLGPQKACPSCREPSGTNRGLKDQAGEVSTSVLALGEPCGVYTLSCARGLRCMPPPRESSPLQALLQGRGVCSTNYTARTPERPLPTGLDMTSNGELEKAPCRRLQHAVLGGLELTVIQPNPDIYIPNCDTRGFYRRKQCWSSKRMQRGHCWCVDEYGRFLPSRTREDGTVQCGSQ